LPQFLTRRHKHLMDESEQALLVASQSRSEQKARISGQILSDNKIHRLWESQHAKLLLPVAEHRKTSQQIVDLRLISTSLIHGTAFTEFIRDHEIRGAERERFFARYYGPMDYQNAVLAAHRSYMLSVSSMLSTNHLIDIMFDPISHRLLQRYRDIYRQYFELSTYASDDSIAYCAKALLPIMHDTKKQLNNLRQKLVTEAPHTRCNEIERQACLARSGRYPALNYL
jgi:hypothetical protein